MDSVVYVWRRPTGEPFYIGMGREGRQHHPWRNRHTNAIRRSIEQAGESVIVEVVFRGTREECILEEYQLISEIGRIADGGPLTNVTVGGESGVPGLVHTEESRARMSAAHLGVPLAPGHAASIGRSLRGYRHSESFKTEISKRMVGNKNSLGHRQTPEHVAKREASRLATLARKRAAANGPADQRVPDLAPVPVLGPTILDEDRRGSQDPV